LWVERYDRDFNIKDILALQDEITRKIVLAMQVKLTDGEQIRLWKKKAGPTNPEAYDKVLRATEYVYQLTQNGNAQARNLYEEAMELDPNYAKPYVGIAWTYISDAWFGWSSSPKQDLEKANKNAEIAMSLNDTVDYTHFTYGLIYLLNRNYDKAIKAARKAVELSPNGAEAHAWLGAILHFTGNDEEAGIMLRRAIRLNPIPRSYYYEFLGSVDTVLGNYDQAIESLNKGLKRNPKNVGLYLCLASAYSLKGRTGKARKIVEHIKKIEPNLSSARVEGVLTYKDPAVTQKFIEALKKAGLN
jgi:adenylate cyclase